jgi:hypothetical protein
VILTILLALIFPFYLLFEYFSIMDVSHLLNNVTSLDELENLSLNAEAKDDSTVGGFWVPWKPERIYRLPGELISKARAHFH